MFKFLRTVVEALGRAGLKVMTIGFRANWLFCGRGFSKASWREMLCSTRLTYEDSVFGERAEILELEKKVGRVLDVG